MRPPYSRPECAYGPCPYPDVCAVNDLCDQPITDREPPPAEKITLRRWLRWHEGTILVVLLAAIIIAAKVGLLP